VFDSRQNRPGVFSLDVAIDNNHGCLPPGPQQKVRILDTSAALKLSVRDGGRPELLFFRLTLLSVTEMMPLSVTTVLVRLVSWDRRGKAFWERLQAPRLRSIQLRGGWCVAAFTILSKVWSI
jgi:hypothetical protein